MIDNGKILAKAGIRSTTAEFRTKVKQKYFCWFKHISPAFTNIMLVAAFYFR